MSGVYIDVMGKCEKKEKDIVSNRQFEKSNYKLNKLLKTIIIFYENKNYNSSLRFGGIVAHVSNNTKLCHIQLHH